MVVENYNEIDTEATAATDVFMTGLRDAVKLSGAYLVAHGAATQQDVSFWSGLVIIAGGVLWSSGISWWKHRQRMSALKAAKQGASP
jgi:hypothetical protein